jgi:sulfate adenylyltransferase subunit 2
MKDYTLSHLQELESESIYVIREVAGQFENPMILFSGGKDSILVLHLAYKAFYPSKIPFTVMHVDTGHNFQETLDYRDRVLEQYQAKLVVERVQESIDKGRVKEEKGPNASRNKLQSVTLMDAIEKHQFDAAMGGARRDEEKARAKERFFSHRDEFGQWDPRQQRPELWNTFNGRKEPGEHFRVFPISNWTEMDVWHYIQEEQIPLPALYFSHKREVVERNGVYLAVSEFVQPQEGEEVKELDVRFRTVGDMTCTGAFESKASNLEEVIREVSTERVTERAGRADDKRSEASMEERKKEGYF